MTAGHMYHSLIKLWLTCSLDAKRDRLHSMYILWISKNGTSRKHQQIGEGKHIKCLLQKNEQQRRRIASMIRIRNLEV